MKIEAKIPEKEFMERILNMYYSELDVLFLIGFYALAHKWHIDKFTHYTNLLK